MSFGVRKAPTGCNFVHNDEIWKDHVRRELQTSRKWPDKWGFLSQASGHSETVRLPSIKERKRIDVNSLVTVLDGALAGGGKNSKREDYPQTTASEVGWKCADFRTLERFGRYARGQQGIRHLLGWPREAVY